MESNKLIIVVPSILTVPAIKGGAVETLLESFIEQNEKYKKFEITVIAHYIKGVEKLTGKYRHTTFKYIKMPTSLIRISSRLMKIPGFPDLYKKSILKEVRKLRYDKILVEGARETAIYLKIQLPNAKIYSHTHGPFYEFSNKQHENVYNTMEKIITVSDFCKNQHIINSSIIKAEKIITVKNGIDVKRFYPENILIDEEEILKRYNLPKEKKIISFKGRMIKEKGVLELVKAFSMIEDENIILLLAGSRNFGAKSVKKSNFENELNELIRKDKRVYHLGYIPYEEVPLLSKISYMSIVPSIWAEPAGLVITEAVAANVPLVISNAGGMQEYVEAGSAEIVNVNGDFINNLSLAIKKVLNDEIAYKTKKELMARNRDVYNDERYYKDLCKVLENKLK